MYNITKIIICIIFVSFITPCLAQDTNLEDAATFKKSVDMKKLSRAEFLIYAKEHFNDNVFAKDLIADMEHIYDVDGVLVSFHIEKTATDDNFLTDLKLKFDQINKRAENYTSKIETVNNRQLLVMLRADWGVKYYNFFIANKKRERVISGIVQFKIADEVKARQTLTNLLKDIKLKSN